MYENNYSKYIEPKYGGLRDLEKDMTLTEICKNQHYFSINFDERIDMTNYDVYSIDPDGCEDADDAFSIFYLDNKLHLAIHIADPTEYIELNSELWNDIMNRITTKYPSNRKPIHMIPDKILKITSLKGNNEIKNSVTVLTEIDTNNYKPKGEIKLCFTKILVKLSNAYSYKEASEMDNYIFKTGLNISNALLNIRAKNTKGVILNDLTIAYTKFTDNIPYLHQDTANEKLMKQMIAEFAIFANSFVGEYLKKNLNIGIFRTCQAKDWLNTIEYNISGEEMIQQIITNGITADYMSNVKSHDLVGMPEYCHFTSPIRRVADCVCHYLLKYIYLKQKNYKDIVIPFTKNELELISTKCLTTTKNDKKNQYVDIKFRLLQVMDNMIFNKGYITLEYYITGYSGLFLNLIICKIDDYNVYMSYTLRLRDYNNKNDLNKHKTIKCTKINCFTKYDENCIPELDNILLNS